MDDETIRGVPKYVLSAVSMLAQQGKTDMRNVMEVISKLKPGRAKDWLRAAPLLRWSQIEQAWEEYQDTLESRSWAE